MNKTTDQLSYSCKNIVCLYKSNTMGIIGDKIIKKYYVYCKKKVNKWGGHIKCHISAYTCKDKVTHSGRNE